MPLIIKGCVNQKGGAIERGLGETEREREREEEEGGGGGITALESR